MRFGLITVCIVALFLSVGATGDATESVAMGAESVAVPAIGSNAEEMPARQKSVTGKRKNRYRLINFRQKLSYAFGLQMGKTVKGMDVPVDLASFLLGFKDSFNGAPPLLGEQKAARLRDRFYEKRREKLSQENLQRGVTFLKENGEKSGILHTSSGLQYEEERKGYGPRPKTTDRVRVQYRGTLIDGTEFDSTYKRGRSIVFSVGRVTKGLSEGLKLMRVGGKTRFYLSPELAYGKNGAGDRIEPNSMLIYDVELLAIER